MGNFFNKYTLTDEVNIKYGKIVGRRIITEPRPVNAFQGIPFAKPPLRELRFRVIFFFFLYVLFFML